MEERKKGEGGGREKIARQPLVSGKKRALQERAAPAATEPGNAAKGEKKKENSLALAQATDSRHLPIQPPCAPPNTPRSHPAHGNRWPLGALLRGSEALLSPFRLHRFPEVLPVPVPPMRPIITTINRDLLLEDTLNWSSTSSGSR